MRVAPITLLLLGLSICVVCVRGQQSPPPISEYELVILNGRVMDPESGLDGIRNIGTRAGKIEVISTENLHGRTIIDAAGLVVAPGFIDLHQHGSDPDIFAENYRAKAADGVTSAFELELGTADVDGWYAARAGKALINYGVSVGHVPVRMKVMHDPGPSWPTGDAANKAASDSEIRRMQEEIEHGLRQGAVAVGFTLSWTPAASPWEVLEMFRVAARSGAPCHVHIRSEREAAIGALEEVIAAAIVTKVPLHIVHLHSVGGSTTPRLLQIIAEARSRGLDVTTEDYPYTAWMGNIKGLPANGLDEKWREETGMDYKDIQWVATGERLSAESFARYYKQGGLIVGFHVSEELVKATIANPLTMIASDGYLKNGQGHPRTSGSYSRVLGRYVREQKALTLMDALRKMTYMPAQRLEQRVPAMREKGRIRVGADADITIFDPDRVIDRATYEQPTLHSAGIKYVIVNGSFVVMDGQLKGDIAPGLPNRASTIDASSLGESKHERRGKGFQ